MPPTPFVFAFDFALATACTRRSHPADLAMFCAANGLGFEENLGVDEAGGGGGARRPGRYTIALGAALEMVVMMLRVAVTGVVAVKDQTAASLQRSAGQ
jgi:hypothetical protein